MDAVETRMKLQTEKTPVMIDVYHNFAFVPGWAQFELVMEYLAGDREVALNQFAQSLSSLRDFGISEKEYQQQLIRFESLGHLLFSSDPYEIAEDAVQELYFERLPQDEVQLSQNFNAFFHQIDRVKLNQGIQDLLSSSNQSFTLIYAQDENLKDLSQNQQAFFAMLTQDGVPFEMDEKTIEMPSITLTDHSNTLPVETDPGFYQWEMPNGVRVNFYQLDDLSHTTHVVLKAKGGIAALSNEERAALDMLYESYIRGSVYTYEAQDYLDWLTWRGIHVEPAVYSSTHDFQSFQS